MDQQQQINLSCNEMEGIPLFFRVIYHNAVTDLEDERKLMRYRPEMQTELFRASDPKRAISKTVNYSLIKQERDNQ